MQCIHTNNLVEGMILAQDIIGNYDLIFLTRGTILTQDHIQRLQKMHLSYIYIYEETENSATPTSLPANTSIDQELNKEYSKNLATFKTIYEEIGLGQKIECEIIEQSVDALIEEVIKSNNILGRLKQINVVDTYTYTHSIDVCILSAMIGKWLNYSKTDLRKLAMTGLLHDIGKCKIPLEILNKPTTLTIEEFDVIKKHTTFGYELLQQQNILDADICCGVLQHHERIDGSGYPSRLQGKNIHEFAKIIAIVDIFDAMTSKRIYKEQQSPFKVAELIAQNRFGILDPYIANQFLWNISNFYSGNIVKLNSGEIGEVVLINKQEPTKPLIKIDNKFIDLLTSPEYEIMEVLA
ncbi:HD-GYP domain-containing protein [Clostridiaceae bacterium 35-E11]